MWTGPPRKRFGAGEVVVQEKDFHGDFNDANGIEQAAFLVETDVQDRVVEMGWSQGKNRAGIREFSKRQCFLSCTPLPFGPSTGSMGEGGGILSGRVAHSQWPRGCSTGFHRLALGGTDKSLDDPRHGRPQTRYPQENTDCKMGDRQHRRPTHCRRAGRNHVAVFLMIVDKELFRRDCQ